MAFAWHKLYPPESIVSVYVFECGVTPCTCWIPPNHCTNPSAPECSCTYEVKCRPLNPGEICTPTEGQPNLCQIPGQVCETIITCPDTSFDCISTPAGGQTEIDCCRGPICVWGEWTSGAGFQIITNCVVAGTDYGPTTYKIDLGTSGGYAVSRGGTTGSYSIHNAINPAFSLHFGDPDLIPGDGEGLRNIRYWKNPMGMTGTAGANGRGLTAGFQAMCLKTRSTSTQQDNSTANRIMCISGRNVYNYTGVLSGDPMYGRADSFWDDAGGSGLSQMEGSLGRRFPLHDSYLTLPLWGQQTAGGEYTVSSYYGSCVNPYTGCWGCDCTGPTALGGNVSGSGHFSPDSDSLLGTPVGATGGYFSFGSFNPQSYLDNYNFTQNKIIPRTIGQMGARNPLMFPYFDSTGSITGATSHGPRLGVPTCSVWSLMHAVYRRIYTSLIYQTEANGVGPSLYNYNAPTEAEFRATYKGSANGLTGMATRFDDWRTSDPSSYTHGQSNAHHYLNKFALAVAQDTKNASGIETPLQEWGDNGASVLNGIQFIPPNVFLWDEAAYRAASGAEKWKHLFVIGNANVVYDGGCKSIKTGMTATSIGTSSSVTAQNHKSHIFYLDDITNSINAGTLTGFNGYTGGVAMGGEEARHVTPKSNHARIFVFKGCNDATGGNAQTPIASVVNRRLSTAQIQLDMLPYYGQIFPGSPCTNDSYSICDICNTFPEYPCFGASEPRNCTGQDCAPGENNIIGTGCFPNQIEQRRISNHKSF